MSNLCKILKNLNSKLQAFYGKNVKNDTQKPLPSLQCTTSIIDRQTPNFKDNSKSRANNGPQTTNCLFFEVVGLSTLVGLVGLQYAVLRRRTAEWSKNSLKNLHPSLSILKNIESKFVASVLTDPIDLVIPSAASNLTDDDHSSQNVFAENIKSSNKIDDDTQEDLTEHEEFNRDITFQDESTSTIEAHLEKVKNAGDLCASVVHNDIALHLLSHQQHRKALDLFKAGCELGSEKACFNAGICYELGLGTECDLNKAKSYYEKAAEKGHIQAVYNLGIIFLQDRENSTNVNMAVELIKTAAEQGLLEANIALGTYYIENQKPSEALPFLEAAASQGDAAAEFYLGVCYEKGWTVNKDLEKAAAFYSQAASKDHVDAIYNLGIFHEFGLGGLPLHKEKALELYHWGKLKGHVPSQQRIHYLEHRESQEPNHEAITNNTSSRSRSSFHSLSEQLKCFLDEEPLVHKRTTENELLPLGSNSLHFTSMKNTLYI